ncbi:guanine nucleotide binding protein, alpha subunit [Sistotremastrum niveocremeum HHB9708]|uniref:Guanine nucleotide binding protein, alpha subunit n=1 Tax=Sistotremastrum niveocremeum HHB9708 TaxID=1314777 RepID=A0A164R419_9AGAM|nr:guanine nucleotide binding protein, alpha subunit [Sistotremastrum niveocremeum HHB9708]
MSTNDDPEAARLNRVAEKELKETKVKRDLEVKVLLLGSGDSGKSTIIKQMRVIHGVRWPPEEVENFRHQVFNNLVFGLKEVLDALEYFELELTEENKQYVPLFESPPDIKDNEPFPMEYLEPLQKLWADPTIQKAWVRANEAALPENLSYFFPQLDRLFSPAYEPTDQDIIRTRVRTIGVQTTSFSLKPQTMIMVDVGGQKSERRKWIHCFQDVTSILFLVSLSGYDQCLVEDKDANQMMDAMTIWDSICHSQWFKNTSVILFLNKQDLFEEKIKHSHIKNTFPDYEGPTGDAHEGKEYFKKRFLRLSQKGGRPKEREIYVHFTTATDTEMLRVIMAAVEGIALRGNLEKAALI